ncbi:MAG TPA: hypothetical protein VJI46_05565 [Candidatus Nanoarchaeia archaeon]|nr:hypothetical protein [Candidatus Nanoarchaeia archaeon]
MEIPKFIPKSLNNSYNLSYNRETAVITFSPHLFDRKEYRNLDLEKIEETVRTGKLHNEKCQEPNKMRFRKYFGKENVTYIVVVRCYNDFIEVKTAWPKKGN